MATVTCMGSSWVSTNTDGRSELVPLTQQSLLKCHLALSRGGEGADTPAEHFWHSAPFQHHLNFTTSGAGLDSAIVSPLLFTVTLYIPTSLTASGGSVACSSVRLMNLVSSSLPLMRTRWNGQKPLPLTFKVVPVPCAIMAGATSMVVDSCCQELNSGIGFT